MVTRSAFWWIENGFKVDAANGYFAFRKLLFVFDKEADECLSTSFASAVVRSRRRLNCIR